MENFIVYLSKSLAKINKENKECYIAGGTNNKYAEFLNTVTSLVSFVLSYSQPELLNIAQPLLIILMAIILNKNSVVIS